MAAQVIGWVIDGADFGIACDGAEITNSYAPANIAAVANVRVLAYQSFRVDSDSAIKFHRLHQNGFR